ncbi:nucleoside recognition protein [Thermodesulfobacteriota bacterium]
MHIEKPPLSTRALPARHRKISSRAAPLAISLSASAAALILATGMLEHLTPERAASDLLVPLGRLILYVCCGLLAGQTIEALGWARTAGVVAAPLFKFGNLGERCSAVFTTAFVSGVSANAMLMGFYRDKTITRQQLFLTCFVNHLPTYILHLPTTLFIALPLVGMAGLWYFALTFAATLVRTAAFLLYGRIRLPPVCERSAPDTPEHPVPASRRVPLLLQQLRRTFPKRVITITVYIVPMYTAVFICNQLGFFTILRGWIASCFVTTVLPVESMSLVVVSFAAEFSSGLAAAGALLGEGVLSTKQVVLALLMGNIIGTPIRALRHQLPRYAGIFSPGMGTRLLIAGQTFRMLSVIAAGALYFYFG